MGRFKIGALIWDELLFFNFLGVLFLILGYLVCFFVSRWVYEVDDIIHAWFRIFMSAFFYCF